ncbi:MAG: OmpA family protein [Paracoccaceae bacterium]
MRFIAVIATLMVVAPYGTAAMAQDYTDQELLELFQNQRDAFNAAKRSATGATRGLKLVTVDDVDAPTTAENSTVTVQSEVTTLSAPTAPSEAPALKPLTTNAELDPNTPLAPQKVVFGELNAALQVNVRIEFAFDSAALSDDQLPALTQLCTVMKASDINLFRIVGHTDASGSDSYNEKLSLLRAEEVQRHMATNCGIDASRLEAIGLGERFLYDPANPGADGNRRVEFQALS